MQAPDRDHPWRPDAGRTADRCRSSGSFALGLTPSVRRSCACQLKVSSNGSPSRREGRGCFNRGTLRPCVHPSRIERLCLTAAIERGNAAWEAGNRCSDARLVTHASAGSDRIGSRRLHGRRSAPPVSRRARCGLWFRLAASILEHACGPFRAVQEIRLLSHREAEAEVRDVNAEHRPSWPPCSTERGARQCPDGRALAGYREIGCRLLDMT